MHVIYQPYRCILYGAPRGLKKELTKLGYKKHGRCTYLFACEFNPQFAMDLRCLREKFKC